MVDLPEKECTICGGFFKPNTKNQKYCPSCGKHSERKWRTLNRNLDRIARLYAPSTAQKYKHTCTVCGKEFEDTSEVNDYCSGRCKAADRIANLKCEYCGKNLQQAGVDINPENYHAQFCSDECRQQYKWQKAKAAGKIGICKTCGKEYIKKTDKNVFCSMECYRKDMQKNMKSHTDKKPKMETRICPFCKQKFKVDANSFQYFCSEEHRIEHNREKQRIQQQRKQEAYDKRWSKYVKENGLCGVCKTLYSECERMKSNFRMSPEGAVFENGRIVKCPKFQKDKKGTKI